MMEQIGLASAIIALILGIGFLFLANKYDKNGQNSTGKTSNYNEQKNTLGGTATVLLFFVFLVTFYLSCFLSFK
jgi:hypothetical protein